MSLKPPPVFILTCMRSYSSLVSAMLGEHPQMYAFPELNLFVADKVGGLKWFASFRRHGLSGLLRSIAHIEWGRQDAEAIDQAKQWLEARSHWSTQRLFEYLAAAAVPAICIEKSPSTAMRKSFLERMYKMFPEARFLHLTRHPRSTCRSIHAIVRHTDSIRGWKRNIDPESLWREANDNIVSFIRQLPHAQWMRLRGEDLLSDPDGYLPQVAEWLGISSSEEAIEAMKHPERSPYAFLGPSNAPFGNDPNFLRHPAYEKRPLAHASLAGPLEWAGPASRFADETLALARTFGYE